MQKCFKYIYHNNYIESIGKICTMLYGYYVTYKLTCYAGQTECIIHFMLYKKN